MVGPDEFRAFQQQVTGQLRSNAQAVTAQEADVKRLSDQMAALSAKMEAHSRLQLHLLERPCRWQRRPPQGNLSRNPRHTFRRDLLRCRSNPTEYWRSGVILIFAGPLGGLPWLQEARWRVLDLSAVMLPAGMRECPVIWLGSRRRRQCLSNDTKKSAVRAAMSRPIGASA
jgi:uncharacterized coiled-coil protein SlyX